MHRRVHIFLFILGCVVPHIAHAYIGPGAGFAFLGSTFVFVLTIFLGIITILFWPFQWAIRKIRGKGISKRARTRRVVVLGLDGLEPKLVDSFMASGKLPNLKKLSESGSYSRLGTTLPALSPVAWSTFQTGVNPGAHNIFDFLTRDKRFCLPQLSSTETVSGKRKVGFGPFKITLGRDRVELLRKSQPFWKILGKYGIFSNILRVPISYPPEKFEGNILSAMCTPDLRGTQGTFSFFTTRENVVHELEHSSEATGGEMYKLSRNGNTLAGDLLGPPNPKNPKETLKLSFTLELNGSGAQLAIGKERYKLALNEFSSWIPVHFRFGRKNLQGICRFCLREAGENVSLYVSPINVDPEKPALPISHPVFFSSWIAKQQGPYGTLGLMEDTWGRNELALDDKRFLEQVYLTHDEREKMFMEALDKTSEGVCACVFDASDRIQHMFWRYLDPEHPSPREDPSFSNVIENMYEKMDLLVGKTVSKLKPDDVLIVMSDHGFSSFRRCVAVNAWLYKEGYLAVKETGVTGADFFQDVDWTKTRAFAVGLSGLYVNLKGRERFGTVSRDEFDALKSEIGTKLEKLSDPKGGKAIRRVYDTAKIYRGLYAKEAPDLVLGYEAGYRVSWDSVTGVIEPEIFSDNTKAWSGDHHIDPPLVPGILFTNRKVKDEKPHISDLAPTILDLFAVPVPNHMEGKVIL